jgi:flagellar hook-associated protein FlgK
VLVNGNNSRDLQVTTSPSFATGGVPPLLNGNLPNYIVYDYGSGGTPAHIDLTQVLKGGSGTVGGLLQLRGYAAPNSSSATPTPFEADGILTEMGARVEAITQQLLTTFNSAYLGDDLDSGTVGHQPSSVGLDGTIPSVYGFFDFEYSGAKNPTGGGLPDEDINNHAGVSNYSSRLQLTISDPRQIAAALNTGTIGTPVFAQGDGQILEALSAIQNDSTLDFNVGSVSFTGTFGGAYAEAVGFVGNTKQGADIQRDVSADNLITAQNSRDEVSGVSLDEEFANLIKFQKAYQASAKMIKIADTLLDQIVNLI